MHYWKTALLTLVIFALGGLAGSLVTAHVIKSRIEKVEATQPIAGIEQGDFVPRMMHIMEKQLNLQQAQTGRARDIMKRAQQEILRLNGDWRQKASELQPLSPELLASRNEWRLKSRDSSLNPTPPSAACSRRSSFPSLRNSSASAARSSCLTGPTAVRRPARVSASRSARP